MDINKIIPGRMDNVNQPGTATTKMRPGQYNSGLGKPDVDVKLTKENMNDLVDVLNSAARSVNQRVSFSFHEETQRVIMKIIDTDTDEVKREIPPKEMIRLLEHMHELIGMFVDESR